MTQLLRTFSLFTFYTHQLSLKMTIFNVFHTRA
jgi:hypothetical protein